MAPIAKVSVDVPDTDRQLLNVAVERFALRLFIWDVRGLKSDPEAGCHDWGFS
jgi:hypothetical protein